VSLILFGNFRRRRGASMPGQRSGRPGRSTAPLGFLRRPRSQLLAGAR
jgi:hypothetical protein